MRQNITLKIDAVGDFRKVKTILHNLEDSAFRNEKNALSLAQGVRTVQRNLLYIGNQLKKFSLLMNR